MRTDPSSTWLTFSSRAISLMSRLSPLNWKDEVRAATRNSGTWASTLSSSSEIPSEKYSCSGSEDRLTKGSTAMDFSSIAAAALPVGAPAAGSPGVSTSAAGACCGAGRSDSHRVSPPTQSSMTMIVRLSLCAVTWVMDWDRSTSRSGLMPSGVISKAQANARAGMKPMASRPSRVGMTQPGVPRASSKVSAICSSNQDVTT